jgi:hypothetical protein
MSSQASADRHAMTCLFSPFPNDLPRLLDPDPPTPTSLLGARHAMLSQSAPRPTSPSNPLFSFPLKPKRRASPGQLWPTAVRQSKSRRVLPFLYDTPFLGQATPTHPPLAHSARHALPCRGTSSRNTSRQRKEPPPRNGRGFFSEDYAGWLLSTSRRARSGW